MTGSDVLTMACNIISEASGSEVTHSVLKSRAPYILAAFCGEAGLIDRRYRAAFGFSDQPAFDRTSLPLDSEFPLCDRLAPIAAGYLASVLIAEENPSLATALAEGCRDSLAEAYGEIPATVHPIKNVYF